MHFLFFIVNKINNKKINNMIKKLYAFLTYLIFYYYFQFIFQYQSKLIIKMQILNTVLESLIKSLIFFLIIQSSLTLHLHYHVSINQNIRSNNHMSQKIQEQFLTHRQANNDPTLVAYVQALKQQKSSFQNQLLNIQSYTSNMENQIQSIPASASNISQKINLYEDLILSTRQMLAQMRNQLNIPLNQTNSLCQTIPPQQLLTLTSDINQLNNKINDINSSILSQIQNSTQKQSLNQLILQLQQENNQTLKNIYANVTQNQASPQINNNTNLIDPQWLVGNQSISALNNNEQSQNVNLYGVSCPQQTPYATSNNQCIRCPSSSPYFDVLLSKCVVCLNVGQYHNCLDGQNSSLPTPIYNSTNFDVGNSKLLVPPNKSLNDYFQSTTINTCPATTPFYNGSNCINCQTLFDLNTKTCTSCSLNQTFNSTTHTCQNISTSTPNPNIITPINITTPNISTISIYATNKNNYTNVLIPTGQSFSQYQADQADKANKNSIIYCNSSTPYFNGSSCIFCNQNEVFSIITMACANCSTLQFFNNLTHHCENKTFYSNLENQNWMSKIKTLQQIISDQALLSNIAGSQQCPYLTPYYNNFTCIACSNDQYFSFDSLNCQSCSSNQAFSKSTHQCQKFQGYYQTNPSIAPNLIYDGHSKNQWMHSYYANIDTNPETQDCPTKTPYFDGASCIACTTQKLYFNLGTQVCQKCQVGQNYDETTHECLSSGKDLVSQAPTLQKMAAGIFS